MTDASGRFFLQAIDNDHGCPILEAVFHVADLDELRFLLGSGAEDDPQLRGSYTIDANELTSITERFGVAFDPGGREVHLTRWHGLRAVPYLVHTNYELALLLDGAKPFARMGDEYPPHSHHDEERFDRYVEQGLLHKEVSIESFPKPLVSKDGRSVEGHRTAYYTLKGEEWRIPAWKLVYAASQKSGWNIHYERLEGMLLGYTDWQMDWWITDVRQHSEAIRLASGQ